MVSAVEAGASGLDSSQVDDRVDMDGTFVSYRLRVGFRVLFSTYEFTINLARQALRTHRKGTRQICL